MAWSSASLSGDTLTGHNADAPLLLGTHTIRDAFWAVASPTAIWTESGATTDTDRTESGYPVYRAWDGFHHKNTRPDAGTVSTTWYYSIDLGGNESFDALFLYGYIVSVTSIVLQVADDSGFTTNLSDILTLTVAGSYGDGTGALNQRVAHARLSDSGTAPEAFSARYVRLKFVGSLRPEIGELWLGDRAQLLRHANFPWADRFERSRYDFSMTRSGVPATYEHNRAGARRPVRLDAITDAEADVLVDWWRATREGSSSFVWMENPDTGAKGYSMGWAGEPGFDLQFINGPNHRVIDLAMREISPYEAA